MPPVVPVVVERVVDSVVVERVGAVGAVTVVVEPESSAAMMITATPSPITRASRMPMIHRVRVSTALLNGLLLGFACGAPSH